ncbi:MAG: hypothetical protein ACM3RP_03850 [Chitinophagales bacterium]
MNYGFLPAYWIKFVGWTEDSQYFVYDKNYPGLFKGGCGYFKVTAATGEISPIDQSTVTVK